MVLFRPKRKSMDFNLGIKLNEKQLYENNSVKYLTIRADNERNWKAHVNDIALKLIRANAMLYKVRDFVNTGILKSIMHVLYGDRICAQSIDFLIIQKQALRLIHFKKHNTHTASLFFKSKIVKLPNKNKF